MNIRNGLSCFSTASAVAGGILGIVVVACGGADPTALQPGQPTPASARGAGGEGFGGAPGSSASDRCGAVGDTRACCTTGTQTCKGGGEFNSWAPCVDKAGAPVTCEPVGSGGGGGGGGTNGGTKDGAKDGGGSDGAATCGPGMTCKPGAIRYCDTPGTEWTKSVCDSAGSWGPCLQTTAPSGAGCDQNSYAPEKCCPPLGLCCQDNPGGPFVDFGTGACAAISCK